MKFKYKYAKFSIKLHSFQNLCKDNIVMTKNEQIAKTKAETQLKRSNQTIKVYELKVNCHHTSKEDFKNLNRLFIETKWIINDMIASDNIFKYNYKDHRVITNFNKDRELTERKLTIQTGVHQNVIQMNKQNIINLSKAKKKGRKVGKLKFKRQINCIPLKTGMFKVKSSKKVSIPGFRNLPVYGLEQFITKDYEIANCNIIKKASGYYLKVSVYFPKGSRQKTGKEVGLDFGIKDSITTSDGEKFQCSVQESEYLKFLQRKLNKKQKGSKRYYKLKNQIQKEYEHLSNKKDDDSNKLLSYLLKEYDVIYYQDENLAGWRKFNRHYAIKIQQGYLGRIKAKLNQLEKNTRSFKINRWSPTTKFCPNCGAISSNRVLKDRIYKCDCGYEYDRDVHAARNVKKFGQLKKTECLEQASVELNTSGTFNLLNELSICEEAKTRKITAFRQ